jgi:ribosomal protein L32E
MGNKKRIRIPGELIEEARRLHGKSAARELAGYIAQGNRIAAIQRCRELGIDVQD